MNTRSHRDHFVEPPSLFQRIYSSLPPVAKTTIARIQTRATRLATSYTRETRRRRRCGYALWLLRLVCSLQNILILLWVVTLWWGERKVFRDSVRECEWAGWERWVCLWFLLTLIVAINWPLLVYKPFKLTNSVLRYAAARSFTPSCCLRGRPPVGGSTYIPRPAVAALVPDDILRWFISLSNLLIAPAGSEARYHFFLRGSVWWG